MMPKIKNCIVMDGISEFIKEKLKLHRGRVAILVPIFSKYDGAGRVAEQQTKELSENGYDVTVFTLEADITLPNVKVEVLGAPRNFFLNRIYRAFFFLDLRAIKWASKLKSFDLVIAHHYPLTYLAYIAKKRYNVKYCFFNHGQPPYEVLLRLLSRNFIERMYNVVMNKTEDWTIKSADFAISNSKFSRERLKDRVGMDSVVIYNKVDTERFKNVDVNGRVVRERYGIGDDPIILFVGRIAPSKGVHLLIQAFKLVRREIPEAKMIIVGKPYYKDYFEELKRMSDESIIFVGYVPDEELPYYYAACDVYATCSLWEGFNLPLAEAQACGKPVVAFDIGPHREVIKNEFLVKERDVKSFSKGIIEILKLKKKVRLS